MRAAPATMALLVLAGCAFNPTGATDPAIDADPATVDAPAIDADPATVDAPAIDADPATVDAPVIDAAAIDAAAIDAAAIDAAAIDAAAIDAPATTCTLERTSAGVSAGQVGSNGGSDSPFLDCGPSQLPIGVAIRLSNQSTDNGGRSAHGFTLTCATVTLTAAGATVTGEQSYERLGAGGSRWTPSTQSAITRCPAGWIIGGITAHRGASDNLFANVDLTCFEVGLTGATTGQTMTLAVPGSGTATLNPDSATCAAGTVVRVDTRSGAGIDAVSPYCAALRCAP